MSKVLPYSLLQPSTSPLPVSWYSDDKIFELEMKLIFESGARYVGHELMVPHLNDFHAQVGCDSARILSHQEDGIYDMSNVCRHRQAIMLEGSGNAKNIVCPIHRWTYDCKGALVGAPHFSKNPQLNLEKQKLENWQGLLFNGPRSATSDLSGMRFSEVFDFRGYRLDRIEKHLCNYNWKTFIEVYLEDYHVASYHPGLGGVVTCDDLSWQFGDWYSVQQVGLQSLMKPGSATYQRWHNAVLNYHDGKLPKYGAIWLTYYPNVMVEWYPQVLIVSTLIPQSVSETLNVVEFYYAEDIALFEPEFIAAQQAAYMETAREDDDIAERMDRGRYALKKQRRNETGPYQSPMEDGMRHFHEHYRRIMGANLG